MFSGWFLTLLGTNPQGLVAGRSIEDSGEEKSAFSLVSRRLEHSGRRVMWLSASIWRCWSQGAGRGARVTLLPSERIRKPR